MLERFISDLIPDSIGWFLLRVILVSVLMLCMILPFINVCA